MTGTESLDGEQKPRCRPMTDGEPRSTDQRKRGLKALIIFYLPPTVTASKERFLQIFLCRHRDRLRSCQLGSTTQCPRTGSPVGASCCCARLRAQRRTRDRLPRSPGGHQIACPQSAQTTLGSCGGIRRRFHWFSPRFQTEPSFQPTTSRHAPY